MGDFMTQDFGSGNVIGRWQLGPGVTLHGQATVHPARLIGATDGDDRLVELHPLTDDGNEADALVSAIRQASQISHPGLLTVLDVGSAVHEGRAVLYVVTARWDEGLGQGPRPDADLVTMTRSVAGGLAALHRAGINHGAIHRGALRFSGGTWQLAGAGLAPVLAAEIAPYRPPGLGVVEPVAAPADIWNLGVVLHEQAAGRLLRPGERPVLPHAPATESVLHGLLYLDPAGRPTADAVAKGVLTRSPADHRAPDAHTTDRWPAAPVPSPDSAEQGAGPSTLPEAVADSPAELVGSRPRIVILALGLVGLVAAAGLGFMAVRSDEPTGQSGDSIEAGIETDDTETSDQPTGDNDDASPAGRPGADEAESEEPSPGAESGAVGPVAVADLAVGDCVIIDLGQGLFSEVDRTPCDDSHNAEVTALVESADTTGQYPGRGALLSDGSVLCSEAFVQYVGIGEYEGLLSSVALPPTFSDWDTERRRSTICLARPFDGSELTQSIAGRGQAFRLTSGSPVPVSKIFPSQCLAADSVDAFGRQQVFTLVSCNNPHSYEALFLAPVPSFEELADTAMLTAADLQTLGADSQDFCDARSDELVLPPEFPAPMMVIPVIPDELDWQLGDRFLTCVGFWQEPVLGSARFFDMQERGVEPEDLSVDGATDGTDNEQGDESE